MSAGRRSPGPSSPDTTPDTLPCDEVVHEIERRVLWLAVRMVDHANHDRVASDGIKVGGHQASSASMVSIMTALWFAHLGPADRVSVKPHASPVFHAIQYLLGNLDASYLTRLRSAGGLQAYPSRTKDPDPVDFSTGSVGLGAAAPLFASVVRRYVDAHFGGRERSRFISILGDAELDEGNIWEAIADPVTAGLGDVMWIVDLNRQSLDRVVPGVRVNQWVRQFEAAGWHVELAKYGHRLRECMESPGGDHLRGWIDQMPNEQYQSLFSGDSRRTRSRFLEGAPGAVVDFVAGFDDDELATLVTDLGGHDHRELVRAFARCDEITDRPSVVFAYTIKGWGLPIAGNPRNHALLLSPAQIEDLRSSLGVPDDEWAGFDPDSPAGSWVRRRAEALKRGPSARPAVPRVPSSAGLRTTKPMSTQAAFGRVLVELSRDPEIGKVLVSTAPDVATSTNLAGFLGRTGVFDPDVQRSWDSEGGFVWSQGPSGQHLELGISEMNLFLLLGQLGLSWDLSDQPLLAVGTVYDPFVLRGLDAFVYATYSGARFVLAGTPSGITLSPEGGAHQSTMTPSVGLELPGCTLIEPAYPAALDWMLCDALGRIAAAPGGDGGDRDGAYYFRLSTRPLDPAPFQAARARHGETALRRRVVAGAYRLVQAESERDSPELFIAASGAVMPEVLDAAVMLAEEGVAAHVVDVTSLDRLYRAWKSAQTDAVRTATRPTLPGVLRSAFHVRAPLVTVHDGASHAMAWLGSALGVNSISVGVDSFGQSGSIPELYRLHGLDSDAIVNAGLAALSYSEDSDRGAP